METDIIEKLHAHNMFVNRDAFDEIRAHNDYDYLLDELIEFSEENEKFLITTKTIRDYQQREKNRVYESIKENPKTREARAKLDKPFEVLQNTTGMSYTDGDINDIHKYFTSRYEKLRKIIQQNPEYHQVNDIKITSNPTDQLRLVGMVDDIHETKNGHTIMKLDDPTGSTTAIIMKDNEDMKKLSTGIVKDEVIGIQGSTNGNLVHVDEINFPGVQRQDLNNKKKMDFAIAFISDVHIGSKNFDEDSFKRFIKWVNGNEGDEQLANRLKYLVIGGDLVDGIGIFPNQQKELKIKTLHGQYEEAAKFLGDIDDIKIILSPGNHDATRLAEPQPAILEEYAPDLYALDNVTMVSNPSLVDLDGVKVLVYHGRSFDDMVMAMNKTHADTAELMKMLVEKRHLAPIFGERTPLSSEFEDYMVIEDVPDVIHTGHVHINSYVKYKGIHILNSGTFQKQTEFQKVYNIEPTCAQVPVLDCGKMKLLDFS